MSLLERLDLKPTSAMLASRHAATEAASEDKELLQHIKRAWEESKAGAKESSAQMLAVIKAAGESRKKAAATFDAAARAQLLKKASERLTEGMGAVKERSASRSASAVSTPAVALASMASGVPTGPDGCDDLLQQIIELLNEVAQRINDALNDPHNLYRDFRSKPHPDYGSWDGHRDRFYYDRDRLRQKLAEWEANDRCRGRPLSNQEQEDLKEANEFKDKEFPSKPAPSMRQASPPASDGVTIEKVLKVLAVMGLSLALAATIVAAVMDPEPATKLGLAGLTAAEIEELMILLGLAAKAAS